MLHRIFPRQIDNRYRGHWLGAWLIVPVVLVRLAQGVVSMVSPRFVAARADAIPLDRYAPDAADAGRTRTVAPVVLRTVASRDPNISRNVV